MKKIVFLGLLNIITTLLNAQVKLIDSLTFEPISGVNIYADNGVLLGATSMEGQVVLDSLKQEKTDNLTFQHVAYSNLILPFSVIKSKNMIKLVPRSIMIDEVAVADRSRADYVVLKGYFRNLDFFNNKTRYFIDGIVSYYIPLKNKKEKVRFILDEYRIFENKDVSEEFVNVIGKFYNDPPRLIVLKNCSISERLPKGFRLQDEDKKKLIKQENINMGFVQASIDSKVQVYLNLVAPGTTINRSIFKIQGHQSVSVIMETYYNSNVNNIKIDDLANTSKLVVGAVKRKNQERLVPVENSSDFFVLEKEYLTADQVTNKKQQFTKTVYLDAKSNYRSKYWLDLDKYGIPGMLDGIRSQLGKELLER